MSINNHQSDKDKEYMQLALRQAAKGRYTTSPNPAVGCVIVKDNKVIGIGYHHKAGEPHAEIMALRSIATLSASNQKEYTQGNYEVSRLCDTEVVAYKGAEGATCYVTLEPCSHYGRTPPCAQVLIAAKVKRVVIATLDPNPQVAGRGIKMLQEAGIEVEVGVLKKKAYRLNRAFFKSITTLRPYTFLKYGMSLDAKLAISSGESKWITNEESRSDVQRLRLWADAIITSAQTVISDNARLNVRYAELPEKIRSNLKEADIEQPIKVIIDGSGQFTKERDISILEPFAIFKTGHTYIVNYDESIRASEVSINSQQIKPCFKEESYLENITIVKVPALIHADGKKHADLGAVLDFLHTKQVRVAMVESGAKLGTAFLEQDLIDECYCFIGPKLLGKNGVNAFGMADPITLDKAYTFDFCKAKQLGNDVRLTLSKHRDVKWQD